MSCGIFSNDKTHDIHIDAPIKSITTEVVFIDFKITFGKLSIDISLYIKLNIRLYSTAIADASVGVKTPKIIPPTTIKSNIKLGKALKNSIET